ncbi:MAG: hypothetical protein K5773_08730 [Pseudobutyrivibrio sp.]|nr:hypothetical protein [Pseudobutyrivibrio sp.]
MKKKLLYIFLGIALFIGSQGRVYAATNGFEENSRQETNLDTNSDSILEADLKKDSQVKGDASIEESQTENGGKKEDSFISDEEGEDIGDKKSEIGQEGEVAEDNLRETEGELQEGLGDEEEENGEEENEEGDDEETQNRRSRITIKFMDWQDVVVDLDGQTFVLEEAGSYMDFGGVSLSSSMGIPVSDFIAAGKSDSQEYSYLKSVIPYDYLNSFDNVEEFYRKVSACGEYIPSDLQITIYIKNENIETMEIDF